MQAKRWIGIDVGGANLKLADRDGWTHAEPFALWKHPETLSARLRSILPIDDPNAAYALTMTGELADCFRDRSEGVTAIIRSVCEAIGGERSLWVYALNDQWLTPAEGTARCDEVAAANWYASARYALRFLNASERGLLIDIGSTTTDLIPIDRSGVRTSSSSDWERLNESELLYFGVGRTPLCAIAQSLPFRGESIPVMAEWFATTDDCWLVLGYAPESPTDHDTADGRSRTVENSVNRIAHMIGLDHRQFELADAKLAARQIERDLKTRLATAIDRVAPQADVWVIAGHGPTLIPDSSARKVFLSQTLGESVARVGPAYALAVLAAERFA